MMVPNYENAYVPEPKLTEYAHVIHKGYKPTPLQVTFYGMKEFSLQDPDRHFLGVDQDSDEQSATPA
jgi:hypothetical protein